VREEDAWDHAAWVPAADDFGVFDLRHADGVANVRCNGIDGYTPPGPKLKDAGALSPTALRVGTNAGGHLVQDALSGQELVFPISVSWQAVSGS